MRLDRPISCFSVGMGSVPGGTGTEENNDEIHFQGQLACIAKGLKLGICPRTSQFQDPHPTLSQPHTRGASYQYPFQNCIALHHAPTLIIMDPP